MNVHSFGFDLNKNSNKTKTLKLVSENTSYYIYLLKK